LGVQAVVPCASGDLAAWFLATHLGGVESKLAA
jgi:hypothetical protein